MKQHIPVIFLITIKDIFFFKEINPRAKFIYLLFEGNDFISMDFMEIEKEPKSYHRLRRYYVPIIDFLRNPFSIKTSPLSKLIYNQVLAINTKKVKEII